MDILEEARKDAKMIVSNGGGFESPAVFNDQKGKRIVSKGLFIRRTDTLEYDDGSKKKAPYSSITTDIDIFEFTDKYVSLKGWLVTVEGNDYEVVQSNPNRTLGIIQCDLKDV